MEVPDLRFGMRKIDIVKRSIGLPFKGETFHQFFFFGYLGIALQHCLKLTTFSFCMLQRQDFFRNILDHKNHALVNFEGTLLFHSARLILLNWEAVFDALSFTTVTCTCFWVFANTYNAQIQGEKIADFSRLQTHDDPSVWQIWS